MSDESAAERAYEPPVYGEGLSFGIGHRAGFVEGFAAAEARIEELETLLREAYEYAQTVDGLLSTWVASRPSMVQYPEEGPALGERIRAALAEHGATGA